MLGRTVAAAVALLLGASALHAQEAPVVELPMLVTSSGQALDAFTVNTMLKRSGVEALYDPLATAEHLDEVKSLVIAVGVSIKGFGKAGITSETEIERTQELLGAAEEKGIPVIVVHIGGAERRKGQSEEFVSLVAPAADYLIVWKEGNEDDYFTQLSAEKNIPLTVIDLPVTIGKELAGLIKK